MSMIRQIATILIAVVLLALGGSILAGALGTRQVLQEQWRVRNADGASMLALALSQQRGDRALMELVLSAQFDTGHYRRIRLVAESGDVLFQRESPARSGAAPGWFEAVVAMSAPPGEAIASSGWQTLGRVQVDSQSAWAIDALWAALLRQAGWLLMIGAAAVGFAAMAVRSWHKGLERVLHQAEALEHGRFEELPVPRTQELATLTTGMNAMVRRMHALFDEHAVQLAAMQRQVQTDALTGLANRRHFLAQLDQSLDNGEADTAQAEAQAPARGGLLLVRLCEIDALNVRAGHATVDRLLGAVGEVLAAYPARVEGAFAGRLNGSDLALYLPANGMVQETAQALQTALATSLQAADPAAQLALGGVDGLDAQGASAALARADEALARAEYQRPPTVEVITAQDGEGVGEATWRDRIASALIQGRTQLAEFPVVLANGRLLHLECPLRVQLREGGPFVRAARWLPMAVRAQLMDQVDLAAAGLALAAIARDGKSRCIHVSAMALGDAAFVRELERRLAAVPQAAGKLSIEVDEGATEHWRSWRDAAERWRPLGVKLGIDNSSKALGVLADARTYGVDYLKVDGRFIRGLAGDEGLADFARQLVTTARAMGVALYAEGVDDSQDLERLWDLGFDGATGAAVTASR